MSDKTDLALQRLAASATTEAHKKVAGPFMSQLCDAPGTWKIASDSIRMIQARVIYAGRELSPTLEMPAEMRRKYSSYLTLPASATVCNIADIASLIAFCGEAKWSEKCPACEGTSARNEYVSCTFCDGDGIIAPEDKYGYVCDLPVNLALLAPLVELLVGQGKVDLLIEKKKDFACLWLVSDGLRIVQMPMEPNLKDEETRAKWEKAIHWGRSAEVKSDVVV